MTRRKAAAPLSRVQCLRTPTAPLRPPLRRGSHWRLMSHLCLNHLSLADPVEGRRSPDPRFPAELPNRPFLFNQFISPAERPLALTRKTCPKRSS